MSLKKKVKLNVEHYGAMADVELIDDLLAMRRMWVVAHGRRFTPTGRLRKGSTMLEMVDNRLNLEVMKRRDGL